MAVIKVVNQNDAVTSNKPQLQLQPQPQPQQMSRTDSSVANRQEKLPGQNDDGSEHTGATEVQSVRPSLPPQANFAVSNVVFRGETPTVQRERQKQKPLLPSAGFANERIDMSVQKATETVDPKPIQISETHTRSDEIKGRVSDVTEKPMKHIKFFDLEAYSRSQAGSSQPAGVSEPAEKIDGANKSRPDIVRSREPSFNDNIRKPTESAGTVPVGFIAVIEQNETAGPRPQMGGSLAANVIGAQLQTERCRSREASLKENIRNSAGVFGLHAQPAGTTATKENISGPQRSFDKTGSKENICDNTQMSAGFFNFEPPTQEKAADVSFSFDPQMDNWSGNFNTASFDEKMQSLAEPMDTTEQNADDYFDFENLDMGQPVRILLINIQG